MIIATTLCWLAWVMVILNVNPFTDSGLGFTFFYISLGLALLGSISLIFFGLYYFFSRKDLPLFRFVQKSFQAGLFFSLLLILLLFLQGQGYLNRWNVLIFLTIVILLTIYNKLNYRIDYSQIKSN